MSTLKQGPKIIITALLWVSLLLMHIQLWCGTGGLIDWMNMRQQEKKQKRILEDHHAIQDRLLREIKAIKTNPNMLETRIRLDWGMIKPQETFFLMRQYSEDREK